MVITRDVIVTIDTLIELFRDYIGEDEIPWDARPLRLMMNPREKYKLAIEAESEEWKVGMAPLEVKFDIRRVHAIS